MIERGEMLLHKVTVDFLFSDGSTFDSYASQSGRGSTSYSKNFPQPAVMGLTTVYGCHAVQGGTKGYAAYTVTSLN